MTNKKKPLIGITASYNGTTQEVSQRNQYSSAILFAGGIPVLLDRYCDGDASYDALCEHLDGILFSGGADVNPALYHTEKEPGCGDVSDVRDAYEMALYAAASRKGLPMMGICRGIQSMNVFAGGTLHQDIPNHMGTTHDAVSIVSGTMLSGILGCETVATNSWHHQAVRDVAPGCRVAAIGADGTIEAIERLEKPFWLGIQWHPENMYADGADKEKHQLMFKAFVHAAEEYRKQSQKD